MTTPGKAYDIFAEECLNTCLPDIEYADYNGSLFASGGQGEAEDCNPVDIAWALLPEDLPNGVDYPIHQDLERQERSEILRKTYLYNYYYLTRYTAEYAQQNTRLFACQVAYLRAICILAGHAYPGDPPAGCRYNLCRYAEFTLPYVSADNIRDIERAYLLENKTEDLQCGKLSYDDRVSFCIRVLNHGAKPLYTRDANLTQQMAKSLQDQYIDSVCLVAYMFRVRGHHFQIDFEERYTAIWKGTRYAGGQERVGAGLPWDALSRHAYKCITPPQLDEIWRRSVEEGLVSGALKVRYDSPAAGSANVFVLVRGLEDLITAFPALRSRFSDQIQALGKAHSQLSASRWGGSINHTFYNVQRIPFDEGSFSAIGASITAAMRTFCDRAQLLKSKALERIASGAPITGAVSALAMQQYAKSEKLALSYGDA